MIVCALAAALPAGAQVVLDDFSAPIRKNGDGDNLWFTYLGEDPVQTYSLENGMLKVTTGPSPNGVYMDFFPRDHGYPFPSAYAQSFIKQGTWDPNINRLRFRVKCSASVSRSSEGAHNLEMGTYIRKHSGADSSWQGAHYYHQLGINFYANRWVNIELNRVPQHQVGQSPMTNWPEDPEWASSGTHYFDGLTIFYFDTQGGGWNNQTCYFDDFTFASEAGEPDSQVASIATTYNGSAYEVTWAAPKTPAVTYEIRYSTSSLKVKGFSSGTAGGTVTSPGTGYTGTIWKSPAMSEVPVLYVGIKPTSGSAFTEVQIGTGSGGTVTSKCDADGDGSVTSNDVDLSVRAALGTAACTADLDRNGRCDVVDVQRIVNASNGGSCQTSN